MRVSLASSGPSASVNGSGPPSTRVAQDGVLRQVMRGVLPFFCTAFAGMLYGLTVSTVLLRTTAGFEELSEAVFERDQTIRSLEAPSPFASGAASELRK